ncbi:MAG: transposase [Pirellulales bacterium]|nr:transposase [Pirellulales bacterium]
MTPILFYGFNESGKVTIYRHGILPHWRQDKCTYFVTFRLADALPLKLQQELKCRRETWLLARKIDPTDPSWKDRFARLSSAEKRAFERMLGVFINDSLDMNYGSCALRQPEIAKSVANALTYFQNQRVLTGDYVIMPNHVHALMTPMEGVALERLLQSIKTHTAKFANSFLGQSGKFWQKESYDHIVRDIDQLIAFQNYIAQNPKKAKLRQNEYIHKTSLYQVANTSFRE